jgi:hypothetical protein
VDGLGHVLPIAAADAHAVGELQPVVLSPQIDQGCDSVTDNFRVISPKNISPRIFGS